LRPKPWPPTSGRVAARSGRLATNPAPREALEASMQNLQDMTARIRAGEGTLGKLLTDDALARSLSSMSTNLDNITGRISRGEGTAGKFITDQALYDRLSSVTTRLDKVVGGLETAREPPVNCSRTSSCMRT
jgi:phospholipid/cholesterol/gamma-HCH transport system substrate-binding protein